MTERRAREIDRLLEDHDRGAPDCTGDLWEVPLKPSTVGDDLWVDIEVRCLGSCRQRWRGKVTRLELITDGRLPEAA